MTIYTGMFWSVEKLHKVNLTVRVFLSLFGGALLAVYSTSAFAHEPTVSGQQADTLAALTTDEKNYLANLQVLRVAVIDGQPPLTYLDNGQPKGYLNELLQLVTDRLGLKVEFTNMSYAQSINALKAGQVDLLNDYSSYGDRSDYLLETQPVLISPFVVVGQTGVTSVRTLSDLVKKRVVLVRGFQQTQIFQSQFPDYQPVLVDSIDAAYRALRSNDADYYIDNATHAGYYLRQHLISDLEIVGEIPAGEIGKLRLHFAVNNHHPALYSAVEKTLDTIFENKEHSILKERWLYKSDYVPLKLSRAEWQWLADKKEIRVVLDPDWAPVEYRTDSGRYEGISLDYIYKIEKLLGVNIKIVRNLSWQQAIDAIKTKQADMVASVSRTPQREKYMLFTEPYIEMPISIFASTDVSYIGSMDNLIGKRVAVVRGYAIHDWIGNDYPDINLITVENPADGLRMVERGEIDVFIGNVVTTTYYIGKYKIDNVRVAGETEYTNRQTMAVRNDWPEFVGILQKALDAIPHHERNAIYNRWMSIQFEHKIDYTLLLSVIVPVILLLVFAVFWNRILKKQVLVRTRELAETESRFRNFFEQNSSVLLIIDPENGEIVEANSSAVEYYGYDRSQLIGMRMDQINALPSEVTREQQRKITEEKRNFFAFTQRLANGEQREVEVYSTPIFSNNRQLLFSIVHDVTERKLAEALLAKQAHYDTLTDLPNRALAMDRLSHLLRQSDRTQTKTAVMFIDLDDFKKINDTLGHNVGDTLLVEASTRIRHALRDTDTVGRLGGDEFIVLLSNLDEPSAAIPIAEKILDCFKTAFFIQKRDLILTCSIGISIYPDDGDNALTLLRNADSAMYHAKESGRNMFAFFTKAMNTSVSRRLNLEEQMNGALERNELYLHFQPKVSIETGAITGIEALLRWNNPLLGQVRPDEFIPVAEQTGLIVPIGEFVIKESLRVLVECQQRFNRDISMAVNLSPRQFRDPGLIKFIETSVEESGIDWNYLEFEITEGVLLLGLSYIENAINYLNQKGATLAMDDFGTGYSSMSYLRRFPFEVIKIDRSFVMDITNDEHDLELVNAIIAMAHSLGLQVVAEGVETPEQAAILARQNCDIAQGYLFGRPLAESDLYSLIVKNQSQQPQKLPRSS